MLAAGLALALLICSSLSIATAAENLRQNIMARVLGHDTNPPADDDHDDNGSTTAILEWRNISSLGIARANPATVVLKNGDILVAGGLIATGTPTATTEIFNLTKSVWKPGPTMQSARVGHTATLLGDGTILIAGGETGRGATASAELLNASAGFSAPLPSMSFAREAHAAILLQNGKVLVTGGSDFAGSTWFQAELYDPSRHGWLPGGSMIKPRVFLTLQSLPGGDVLAIGGDSTGTSERYSPATNVWSGLLQMNSKRYSSNSVTLTDGRILVAGGIINGSALSTAELFSPRGSSWTNTGNMSLGRGMFSLTVLKTGDVLAAGSKSGSGTTNTTERFHPDNGTWTAAPPMHKSRGAQGYAVSPNGTVIEIGGYTGPAITSSVEALMPFTKPVIKPEICRPIDIVPLVRNASGFRGNSENGLIAKLEAAQSKFDSGDNATCLDIMNAFHNQLRAFVNSGHISLADALILQDAYESVVECLGGAPQPLVSMNVISYFLLIFT